MYMYVYIYTHMLRQKYYIHLTVRSAVYVRHSNNGTRESCILNPLRIMFLLIVCFYVKRRIL